MFELVLEMVGVGTLLAVIALGALVVARLAFGHMLARWPWRS